VPVTILIIMINLTVNQVLYPVAMIIYQQQKDLIIKIYSGQAGGFFAVAHNFIGEMLGVKSVPIEFGIDGKRRWLRVKDALELDAEAIAGGDKSRDSVVVNVPFSVVPGADMSVECCTFKQIQL
jgi:hypothetical protein